MQAGLSETVLIRWRIQFHLLKFLRVTPGLYSKFFVCGIVLITKLAPTYIKWWLMSSNKWKSVGLPDVKKHKNAKNRPTSAQILCDPKYDSLYISSWMRPAIQTPVAATSKATAINDTITKQRDQWGLWSFPHFRKISFHKFFRIPAGFCFTANLLQAVKN